MLQLPTTLNPQRLSHRSRDSSSIPRLSTLRVSMPNPRSPKSTTAQHHSDKGSIAASTAIPERCFTGSLGWQRGMMLFENLLDDED